MSLNTLDSSQTACLIIMTVLLACTLIFCIIKPKFVDQINVQLTAKFVRYCEQRRTKRAQWKADHPPKRTSKETTFLRRKISLLTMAGCLIGVLILCIVCLLQGKHNFGPTEQIVAFVLWIITMFGFVLGIYSDTESSPKENPTTPTAEAKSTTATKTPEP